MDVAFFISFGLVFAGGVLVLACCLLSLVFPSQKGQILFDFSSWPHHKMLSLPTGAPSIPS
jgi:hypothetical protein